MSKTFKRHEATVNKYAAELIELENRIKTIKETDEWMAAMNYFGKMQNGRKIQEAPTKKNGYKIKLL